jgi:hypothetical protein
VPAQLLGDLLLAFCGSGYPVVSPASGPPALPPRSRAKSPFPLRRPYGRPRGVPAPSSGPGFLGIRRNQSPHSATRFASSRTSSADAPSDWSAHPVSFAPQVNAGYVAQTIGKPSICMFLLVLLSHHHHLACGSPHFSEHDRPGWPHAASDLGECYESLANVQLPSRNHALQAAYARMKERALAAVALCRTIALCNQQSQGIQSGPTGGRRLALTCSAFAQPQGPNLTAQRGPRPNSLSWPARGPVKGTPFGPTGQSRSKRGSKSRTSWTAWCC